MLGLRQSLESVSALRKGMGLRLELEVGCPSGPGLSEG